MSNWKDKEFEEKMSVLIDAIYSSIFKTKLESVDRSSMHNYSFTNNKWFTLFLDIELGIDTVLRFINGSIITVQEKTRRNNYAKYNDFTFEYYNDPEEKIKGEWFKLSAQMYFYGYANENETGYSKYWLIDVLKLRTKLLNNYSVSDLEKRFLKSNKPPAKANFLCIPFDDLEQMEGVIIHRYPKSIMKTPKN